MGLAESALILLGIGIVSSRFQAGIGLGELGTGIQTLVQAPLVGTGTGLSSLAGGLTDIFETFGELGRGLGALFENIPKIPTIPGLPKLPFTGGNGNGNGLMTVSGGDDASNATGGGGNVPPPGESWFTRQDPSDLPSTMYSWAPSARNGWDVWRA